MENPKSQLIDRIKSANTVMVTVSRNPSVDELAACIGLTLIINKMDKHGSAVFSGQIPSTIEFLKPEDTLEKNTDSLRDFIIALDKSKADKLRYKLEDDMVKIFITPYRTSLSEKDLEFSQGDFNVDLIISLGVHEQPELDEAILAHGRILHDATVATLSKNSPSTLGSINWTEPTASSLCEMVSSLGEQLGENIIDEQIATSLLTGIVAETDRFSNSHTTSQTMAVSANLMSHGANQQLVANELADDAQPAIGEAVKTDQLPQEEDQADVYNGPQNSQEEAIPADTPKKEEDGVLSIDHEDEEEPQKPTETLPPVDYQGQTSVDNLPPVPQPELPPAPMQQPADMPPPDNLASGGSRFVSEPPTRSGMLTANSRPEMEEPALDSLGPQQTPSMPPTPFGGSQAPQPEALPPQPAMQNPDFSPVTPQQPGPINRPMPEGFTPPPPAWVPPFSDNQLTGQPQEGNPVIPNHQNEQVTGNIIQPDSGDKTSDIDNAREQVESAIADGPETTKPPEAFNSLPLGAPLHPSAQPEVTPLTPPSGGAGVNPLPPADPAQQNGPTSPLAGLDPTRFSEPPQPQADNSSAPPVPPPITPIPYHFGGNSDGTDSPKE